MESLIDLYMKSIKDKSENTKKSYLNGLIKFNRFFDNKVKNPNQGHFKDYVKYLKSELKSKASFNLSISILKSFAQYLKEEYKTELNLSYFDDEKIKEEPPQYYINSTSVYAMMDGIMRWGRSGPMQAALVGVLYECGLKKSSLLNLKVGNVILKDSKVFILIDEGKLKKEYELSIATSMHLKKYLEIMKIQRRHKNNTHYLFQKMYLNNYDPDNKSLNPKTVNEILAKGCEYANIPLKITPAHIRNSFLQYMKESDLYTTQDKTALAGFKTDIAFYTTCRRLTLVGKQHQKKSLISLDN